MSKTYIVCFVLFSVFLFLLSVKQNMSSSKVTLYSKLTAVSSKPVRSGMTQKLSGLDQAMGSHSVHIVFYYENQSKLFDESFDLDPLRESLSEALTMYPTMTGRVTRGEDGKWEVRCNDAGVRVIKGNVDSGLNEWLESGFESEEASLTAWDDMPLDTNTWSPFRIQINSFQDGGIAIGLSCSHMLADITSAASFFKSWTESHRHLPISHPPSFTSLPNPNTKSLTPHEPFFSFTKSKSQVTPSTRNMTKTTFKFSSSIIKQCLSKVHDSCPNATPFDLLSALFWTRIARLKTNCETHSLSICLDFRRVLNGTLPKGYFGNAIHFSRLSLNEEDVKSGELGSIVSIVNSHVAGVTEEEVRSGLEWFEREGGKGSYVYGSELTCVSLEHLIDSADSDESLLYAAMFGNDERPVHVSCHVGNVDGEGLIMVMPSLEGGLARTVTVVLPEENLTELSSDQNVLQLEPTILLAGPVAEH